MEQFFHFKVLVLIVLSRIEENPRDAKMPAGVTQLEQCFLIIFLKSIKIA